MKKLIPIVLLLSNCLYAQAGAQFGEWRISGTITAQQGSATSAEDISVADVDNHYSGDNAESIFAELFSKFVASVHSGGSDYLCNTNEVLVSLPCIRLGDSEIGFRFDGSSETLITPSGYNGNSHTATSLAANGANCSAGSYPLGVDASGAAEGCTAASSSPAGSDSQVQFNDGGAFGGDAELSYDKTTNTFNIYSLYTDASNYEKLSFSGSQGYSLSISSGTAGTGSDNLSIKLITSGSGEVIASSSGGIRLDDGLATEDVVLAACENTPQASATDGGSLCLLRGSYLDYPASIWVSNLYVAPGYYNGTNAPVMLGNMSATGGQGLALSSDSIIAFASSQQAGSNAEDFWLFRGGSNTLSLKNRSTTPVIFDIYSTADDNSTGYNGITNYELLRISGTLGESLDISAKTGGTGADDLDILLTPAGSGSTVTNYFLLLPSSETPACEEGKSYYDASDHDFCDCVGSSPAWRSRGGAGSCAT